MENKTLGYIINKPPVASEYADRLINENLHLFANTPEVQNVITICLLEYSVDCMKSEIIPIREELQSLSNLPT